MGKGTHIGALKAKPVDHRMTGRNQLGVGKLCPALGGGVEHLEVFMMDSIFIAQQYPCQCNCSANLAMIQRVQYVLWFTRFPVVSFFEVNATLSAHVRAPARWSVHQHRRTFHPQ